MTAPTTGFAHEDRHNDSVDWYTPPWVFSELGMMFDLDPCQPENGVMWIPALQTYNYPHSDGLALPWAGNVWLNPPYGKHTASWLAKMHLHRQGICLVFARTDCAWFHDYIAKADAVLFVRRRIAFVDGLGVSKGGGAGAGSLFAAWGSDCVAALQRLAHRGLIIQPGGHQCLTNM